MSFWTRPMVAAKTTDRPPTTATVFIAASESEKIGAQRATMNTPAGTMVAAWMSALTGVGPSMASGSQTYSGSWADLPVAPTKSRSAMSVITLIALLLFVGATGKSAQLPLYLWLPDAMEGPTPVSALIHAATMVPAGVSMVARSAPVFELAPASLEIVAWIGGLTALCAASIALVQTDIKRIIAYSTISQLGYMFLGLGVGAYAAGIFHLMTHAFFKALLFLGAGSVIHALAGEQDLRGMGGLRRSLKVTAGSFLVGALANAGIAPLAGFWSKDEILA